MKMNRFVLFLWVIEYFLYCSKQPGVCKVRDKCELSVGRQVPHCRCDKLCPYYNDCCKEFLEQYNGNNHSVLPFDIGEACKILTNEPEVQSEKVGAFMVDTCEDTNSFCNTTVGDLYSKIPVSHWNKTYINAECAVCNHESEFSYWNIVFIVSKDTEKRIKMEKFYIDDGTLDEIMNETSVIRYYMRPPDGFIPRYCPFEVLSQERPISERIDYLNVVLCKYKAYRNIEQCLKEGCCQDHTSRCADYILPFDYNEERYRNPSTSFHIVFTFGQIKTLKTEKTVVSSITYGGTDVTMYLKIKKISRSFPTTKNCIHGVIKYLLTSPLRLRLVNLVYFSKKEDTRSYLAKVFLQSTKRLRSKELTDLIEFQQKIRCDDETDSGIFIIDLKLSISTDLEKGDKEDNRYSITDLSKVKLLSWIGYQCDEILLTITDSQHYEVEGQMRCLDRDKQRSSQCPLTCLQSKTFAFILSFSSYFLN